MKSILNIQNSGRNDTENSNVPHIVTIIDNRSYNSVKSNTATDSMNDFFLEFPGQPESIRKLAKKFVSKSATQEVRNRTKLKTSHKTKRGTKERKTTVEIAVFFDAAAYQIFAPHFDYNYDKIRDMLLAYINAVIYLIF